MFAYTTDRAAFIDRIVLNAWSADGTFRVARGKLEHEKNRPILGKGQLYSWCLSGNWGVTGNPVLIVRGRTKRFPNVPLAQITFRSEAVPLTGAQVAVAITELLGAGANVDVSMLELTFDTERTAWWRLRQEAVHRARSWRVLTDGGGRRTLYAGSRFSDTQVRIYQKTETLVRMEFVLRRGYLRSFDITHPSDVVWLRSGHVWELLSLRSCSAERVWAATGSWWRNPYGRKLMCQWRQRGLPNQLLASSLRKGGVDPSRVLIKSRRQRFFEEMLEALIW